MSFVVFADGSGNLPQHMPEGIKLLPSEYFVGDKTEIYDGNMDCFHAGTYYEGLRHGVSVKTSLLNTQVFLSSFTPVLEQGKDIVYVSMSSGISGTYNAAVIAAQELMETYKERTVYILDSKGCGFGSGLLAVRADKLNRQGKEIHEAISVLEEEVIHACQYFTVKDLGFLKRTGRISGVAADVGTILQVNPILYGNDNGKIVTCAKVRGRKKAIEALAKKYKEKKLDVQGQPVCISHGDCLDDAELLKGLVLDISPEAEVVICMHEPISGAHVGPGMLGLFFRGVSR